MNRLSLTGLSAGFGTARVLDEIALEAPGSAVTAIIGPSGSGKSTLLRTVNRLDEDQDGYWCRGSIRLDDRELLGEIDVNALRREIGIVFQKPLVFPASIEANVLFGVRHLPRIPRDRWPAIVRETLEAAALWDEVSERLHRPARELSQGQQQRLSIARALAVEPRILMLDEPTASLDPRSTGLVEDLLLRLGKRMTVILVTHDLDQARRVSQVTAFLDRGRIVEQGPTDRLFEAPVEARTRDYVTRGAGAPRG